VWGVIRFLRQKEYCLKNKFGIPSILRPNGPIIWIHCASVGESLSAMPLIYTLLREKDTSILMTTTTKSSAQFLQKRLPPKAYYQTVPLDHPLFIKRFLNFWRPSSFVLVESDIWPIMISMTSKHRIPFVFVNVRMSDKTINFWIKHKTMIQKLLNHAKFIGVQTKHVLQAFYRFGLTKAILMPNLKYIAQDLPIDKNLLINLKNMVKGRHFFIVSSSHPEEEIFFMDVYDKVRAHIPDVMMLIAPRHPHRADVIFKECQSRSLIVSKRSEEMNPQGHIWILDTIGEMGTLYSLKGVVIMGGSFCAVEGHNPLEPLCLGNDVICGPRMKNFQDIFCDIFQSASVEQCDLYKTVINHLNGLNSNKSAFDRFLSIQKDIDLSLIIKHL
jgi:3-deoxy-D-manno-octulosonic-acid transferase